MKNLPLPGLRDSTSPRPGWILTLVCLPIFIGALDLTIFSAVLPPILPDLQIPYQTGLDDAAWMVSGYLLSYTVSMTFMGHASDIWGRRRVIILCLTIFIIDSILVAIAPGPPAEVIHRIVRNLTSSRPDRAFTSLYVLIFGRVVQAFGAGGLVSISMGLAGDIYPLASRAAAIGVIDSVDMAGWALGHLYGGVVLQYFAWPILFWLNVQLDVIALILKVTAMRSSTQSFEEIRFDWTGAGLLSLSLLGLNLALNTGADPNAGLTLSKTQNSSAFSVPLLAFLGLSLGAFVVLETRSHNPLLDLSAYRV